MTKSKHVYNSQDSTTQLDSSIESTYVKLSPIEHILKKPGMYIGDIDFRNEKQFIYNKSIIHKEITWSPGLYKIVDELIVNAYDQSIRDKTLNIISVVLDNKSFSIFNDGIGIDVVLHPTHKIYIPELIFANLLTSTNYNDTEDRITGGTHGLGAKLSAIFSKKFIIEVWDSTRKLYYIQTYENNLSKISKPIIKKYKFAEITINSNIIINKGGVKITIEPDFNKFKTDSFSNDMIQLLSRRVIDLIGLTRDNIKIYLNNKYIKRENNFESYLQLYPSEHSWIISHCVKNPLWSFAIRFNDNDIPHISFVNGIFTNKGGKHVEYIIDLLLDKFQKIIGSNFTKKLLNDHITICLKSSIVNPTFNSQTKEELNTPITKFGVLNNVSMKCIIPDSFWSNIKNSPLLEQLKQALTLTNQKLLSKTDGSKKSKIKNLPKLEDANFAGTKKSHECTLILTEGDSAKATAISGISAIPNGRNYYGVYPLRGKLLNVREASPAQLMGNEEISNLKQIMGLKHGEDYTDDAKFNQLRYGRIVVLTDADVDGSHIKGLLMNFIHSQWPSLIKRTNFITSLATPILKAFKGNETLSFYNVSEYNTWLDDDESHKNWKIKYYKGLGTSTAVEAREYFVDVEDKLINYSWLESSADEDSSDELPYNKENDEDAILLAFEKSRADDRKVWLQNYDKNNVLLYEEKEVRFSKFIHSDMIHFSNDDLSRSIPSLIDGLKPSQRKILYGAFLRGLDKTEVKVAQLAGFVSDKAAYHHGEASLTGAIVNMAQNYMGSNNINVLKPNGQFGSRLHNGADSASPRYIWTQLEALTSIIFNPSDDAILNKQVEDNEPIEPEFYAPIIPMILVNGTHGIGTGFSTKVPPYDPKEIIQNIKNKLNNKSMNDMDPWWAGFEGQIAKIDDQNYEIYGTWSINDNKLIVTELPVGESTFGYKQFLEKLLEGDIEKKVVKPAGKAVKGKPAAKPKPAAKKEDNFIGYKEANTDTKVYFELEFTSGYLDKAKELDKTYHLCKKYSTSNMHLFDANGTIKKYATPLEIIDEYFYVRLDLYQKRKDHELAILQFQLRMISYKVKFILMIVEKKLVVNNKKKSDLESELEKLKFPRLGKNKDDEDGSYNYLLSMSIYNLTNEKIEELKKQESDKETEYEELDNLSIETIWLNELTKLEKEYDKWITYKEKEASSNKVSKKLKKSKK